ncbi:MAG TPA: GDP-mannose 4,6-dehydratase, partial [Microbacteriaceae bacterium]|nr:GDP-mannose 4,6-dehydratase [Microbacteriaceae bacterium]
PLTETSPTGIDLANPYAKTKRMIEEILHDAAAADPGLRAVTLRYFNPVGAHPSGLIGEDPVGIPNNLMPVLARVAIGALPGVSIYGDDYDTPDGTGLRDYIHVTDLAAGHLASLERAREGYAVFNLGTGKPVSVIQLIEAFRAASGHPIPATVAPRRAGDVTALYANPSKAERELDWTATRTIEQACAEYWHWQERNPDGYRG